MKADEVWTTKDLVCHHGGYVIKDGYIYGNHSGGWTCLKLDTGEQMWFERAVGKGSLCFADDMLYLFSESDGQGALANCSPDGLELSGNVKVDGSGPSAKLGHTDPSGKQRDRQRSDKDSSAR